MNRKDRSRLRMVRWGCVPLVGLVVSAGCGDDQRQAPDTTPPADVADLTVVAITQGSVSLTCTAPENTGEETPAEAYDLRYGPEAVDRFWESAVPVDSLPAPADPGTMESLTVHGLRADSLYSFALRSRDAAGNWSGLSNLAWVQPADTVAPAPILDLLVEDVTPTEVTLTWTAPGDDGLEGTAARYVVRRARTAISSEAWGEATPVPATLTPGPSGTRETLRVAGLEPDRTHYFAVRAEDDGMNLGDLSNVASAFTPRLPRTWYVTVTGEGDAPTIQAAIDSSAAGDTVLVGPGRYLVNTSYSGKDIVVRSQRGPEHTILAGSAEAQSVVRLDGGETRAAILEGFTITSGTGHEGTGGGVLCVGSSPVIRGNRFLQNSVVSEQTQFTFGGAIYVARRTGSDVLAPVIMDNFFQGNAAGLGGAVATFSANIQICGNVFLANSAVGDGGGIFSSMNSGFPVFEDNVFIENFAGDHGGAVFAVNNGYIDATVIRHNLFLRNKALGADAIDTGSGGAIYFSSTGGEISNNTIVFNIADGEGYYNGAGIMLESPLASLRIFGNILAFNSERDGPGCAIACSNPGGFTLEPNLFWQNQGSVLGSAPRECPASWLEVQVLADPLFCDPDADDFQVAEGSPALTGPVPMGAYPWIGCPADSGGSLLPGHTPLDYTPRH